MPDTNPTVWDGKFLQFMNLNTAVIARDQGLVQIFKGPEGYDPGFRMKDGSEFPFTPAAPPLVAPVVASVIAPVIIDEDEDEDEDN